MKLPISLDEFKRLSKEKTATAPPSQLLEFLGDNAFTNKEIAAFLGVSPNNALSRMKRLEKKGLVVRGFSGATIYWAKKVK